MATVKLIGKTFEHRETIKALGGKFNGDDKSWTIRNATDHVVQTCRGLVGVGVSVTGEDQPVPAMPEASPIRHAVKEVERYEGSTVVYGDDLSHGPFAFGTPRVRAGFSSLSKMIDFIETTPMGQRIEGSRSRGWRIGEEDFYATRHMDGAIDLARDGWPDGVRLAKQVMEIIETDNAQVRQRKPSVAGGRVNVGRLLSGNPLHMTHRARQPGRKVVTLYTSINAHSTITTHTMIIRAACVAAMADLLEAAGYSCEIVATDLSLQGPTGPTVVSTTCVLKQASEPMNINDVIFGVGHPSMLRRFSFAVTGYNKAASSIWSNMGSPGASFNNQTPVPTGSFYLNYMAKNISEAMPLTYQIKQMFGMIVPENFPVTLK